MRDIDDTKAPLIEHLVELRRRLLWSLVVLVLLFFGCMTRYVLGISLALVVVLFALIYFFYAAP